MNGIITVIRDDYPKRTVRLHGNEKIIPAWYECRYFWDGQEIAWYNSRDDVLYLKTKYLMPDFKKSMIERMKGSSTPEMWQDLVTFLKIDKNTKMSEYTSI